MILPDFTRTPRCPQPVRSAAAETWSPPDNAPESSTRASPPWKARCVVLDAASSERYAIVATGDKGEPGGAPIGPAATAVEGTCHGIRHLAAIPLLLTAAYVCLAIADRYTGGDLTTEKGYWLLGGLVLYVANEVWSIVTAVADAKGSALASAGHVRLAVSLRWSH